MEPTIAYNTTSMGITGLSNLATQTGTIGTILGCTILIGLIVGAIGASHSWNTKGWLYKLMKWLLRNVGENVLYGLGTTAVVGGVYYVGSELSKFGESNPHFLYDMAILAGQGIAAVILLAVLGYVSKPIWDYAADYASGKKAKVVK